MFTNRSLMIISLDIFQVNLLITLGVKELHFLKKLFNVYSNLLYEKLIECTGRSNFITDFYQRSIFICLESTHLVQIS